MDAQTQVGSGPPQTYHLFLRATPDRIWQAILSPRDSPGYLFGAAVETTGEPGTPFRYRSPDGTQLWGDDTVLEAQPPHRLVISYRALYRPDLAAEAPSRVTWQIEPGTDGVSLLTVVHDRLAASPLTAARVAGPGWMRVLSGLKTLIETGTSLNG